MNAKQRSDRAERDGANPTNTMGEKLRTGTQVLLNEQANYLDCIQSRLAAWTKRRQEGMESAIRVGQKMSSCKDLPSVIGLYGEWMEDSLRRMRADLSDACDEALHLAEIANRTTATLSPITFGVAVWRDAEDASVPAEIAAKSSDDRARQAAE